MGRWWRKIFLFLFLFVSLFVFLFVALSRVLAILALLRLFSRPGPGLWIRVERTGL